MKQFTLTFAITLVTIFITGCATGPRQRVRDSILNCTKDLMDYTKDLNAAFAACERLETEH